MPLALHLSEGLGLNAHKLTARVRAWHWLTLSFQVFNVQLMTPRVSSPRPFTAKAPDVYTELLKLDDLRKRGIITEAEFEVQKKKLLEGR